MIWLLLLCLCCSGCMWAGTSQTAFVLGSAAIATESMAPKGCLWVLGSVGGFRGMALLLSHGGATLEECARIHAISQEHVPVQPSFPSPSP